MKKWIISALIFGAVVFFARPTAKTEDSVVKTPATGESLPEVQAFDMNTFKSDKQVKRVDSDNVVLLEGQIDAMSVAPVLSELRERSRSGKPVYLLINSPGGSVIDGMKIVNFIESSKTPIHTVCTQVCASMGFVILQHGTRRMALDRTLLMAHKASFGAQGQLENMLSMLNTVKRYIDKTDLYIARRSGMSFKEFKDLIVNDLWIDSEDALQKHLLDDIISINLPDNKPAIALPGADEKSKKTFPWDALKLLQY